MVPLRCPKCRFRMNMPEHTLGDRPICPNCSRCALVMTQRDQDRLAGGWRPSRRKAVVAIAPGVIRNLIAGIVLIVVGPALVAWAASWPSRAWFVSAVFMGHGMVLTMWGIICLVLAALRKND